MRPNTKKFLEMARGVFLNGHLAGLGLDKHMPIPEGQLVDRSIQSFLPKKWRKEMAEKLEVLCAGQRGLEIGALHQPLDLPDSLEVDYLDYCSVSELREKYPDKPSYWASFYLMSTGNEYIWAS